MDKIGIGHSEAHEKLTGRLLWKKVGASGYNDSGNAKEYQDATTRSTVSRSRAEDGHRVVNDEQADLTHPAFTFLLDERDSNNEVLLRQATILSNRTQSRGEGATATVTDVVLGKWFTIGAYGIANVRVNASASGLLAEDDDYELDKDNGRIKVLIDAAVSEGETLTLTFDQPELDFERFLSEDDPLFRCDCIIEEHNQHSQQWLRRAAFIGNINVTEFPNQTGEFGTFRIKVTPNEKITWEKRAVATTLDVAPETTGEVAGQSSSSESLSSATSSQSESSSS